ncbi:MAG TPA: family 1 glycosylhydrolase, partial [Gemmatirosa sp.]
MMRTPPTPDGRPEVWAGVECTVNRVGDRFSDQLERGGHAAREDDLDRLAALGITALRYPVLWERTADVDVRHADWGWADRRLTRLRELGVRPIVGLVHHGSGPVGTSLVDPRFPERLARYAGAVAERFPWIDRWTPVNEPLTTARFSGLYGHWYPHGRDDATFATALMHQVLGVRAAMRAVRAVNPAAQLVQTEDLGKTHGTASLAQQVWFDNERRWVTYDLLTGQLAPEDPMWAFLSGAGIDERVLHDLREDPCPPDVIGLNYYITSERFLDPRLRRYPAHTHGGTTWARYADVEAVRVRERGCDGPAALLTEAWTRFGRPLAITEAHLGCTREQQLRWLGDVWNAACRVREAGVDVRAVTAWSAFGAHDWASLLTREDGAYETGLF